MDWLALTIPSLVFKERDFHGRAGDGRVRHAPKMHLAFACGSGRFIARSGERPTLRPLTTDMNRHDRRPSTLGYRTHNHLLGTGGEKRKAQSKESAKRRSSRSEGQYVNLTYNR